MKNLIVILLSLFVIQQASAQDACQVDESKFKPEHQKAIGVFRQLQQKEQWGNCSIQTSTETSCLDHEKFYERFLSLAIKAKPNNQDYYNPNGVSMYFGITDEGYAMGNGKLEKANDSEVILRFDKSAMYTNTSHFVFLNINDHGKIEEIRFEGMVSNFGRAWKFNYKYNCGQL